MPEMRREETLAGGNGKPPGLLVRFAPVLWIDLAMVAAVLYGIINDQITISLSPEYFTVFKRHQFWTLLELTGWILAPARLQAVLIGAAATWWFGLLLGMLLALVGTVGRRPRLTTRGFLRMVGLVVLVTAGTSVAFGGIAYLIAPRLPGMGTPLAAQNYPFLEGIRDTRAAFAVGNWHNGAYLGGLVGTILACVWVRRWRSR